MRILFLTFFLFIIIIAVPIANRHYMKEIKNNLIGKWKLYIEIMLYQWGTILFFFAYWLFTGRTFSDLFFLERTIFPFPRETTLALVVGAGLSMVMLALIIRSSETIRKKTVAAIPNESLHFLLPSSFNERVLFILIAISVSICDEIIFRGILLHYLSNLPIELSLLARGGISSICFGIVHLYQGWRGVLVTTCLGAILFLLYVGTGNLWIPILMHIIIDAKFVFLPDEKAVRKRNSEKILENE